MTSYFDLLTYPIATLGFPLIVWLLFEEGRNHIEKTQKVIYYTLCWGIGYLGMWIQKWIVGSALLKRNIVIDALHQMSVRTSVEIDQKVISRSEAILKNFSTGFYNRILLLLVLIIILSYGLIHTGKIKTLVQISLPYLLISVMPVIWYALLCNHSFAHHWFTYRALSITVFAVLEMLSFYVKVKNE